MTVSRNEARSQDFMAIDNSLKSLAKRGYVKRTRQAQGKWTVVSGTPGLQVFEKPEPLLREGKWQRAPVRKSRDGMADTARLKLLAPTRIN